LVDWLSNELGFDEKINIEYQCPNHNDIRWALEIVEVQPLTEIAASLTLSLKIR